MAESPPTDDEGFTLIEVICALILISITTGIMLETFRVATLSKREAGEKLSALHYVSELEVGLANRGVEISPEVSVRDGQWHTTLETLQELPGNHALSRLDIYRQGSSRHYRFLIVTDGASR